MIGHELHRSGSFWSFLLSIDRGTHFSRPHLQGSVGMYMNFQVRARLVFRRNCFGVVGPTRANSSTTHRRCMARPGMLRKGRRAGTSRDRPILRKLSRDPTYQR
jgi:hypothetical protein